MARHESDFSRETARIAAGRPKGASLAPLKALLPFLRPYRGRIAIAAMALVAAATATLVLPQFARGLIDANGLTAEEARLVLQWRPFSSWDALLQVLEIDAARIAALRAAGADLTDAGVCLWPAPRPFSLSEQSRPPDPHARR